MDTIFAYLKAALGMFTVMTLWISIQAWVKRRSGGAPGRDSLEFMAHNCASCQGSGACHKNEEKEHHHEPA